MCTTPLEDLAAVAQPNAFVTRLCFGLCCSKLQNNRSRDLGTTESGLRSFGAVCVRTANIEYEISTKLVSKSGAVFKLVV